MTTAAKHRASSAGGRGLDHLYDQLGEALNDLSEKQRMFSRDHGDLASLEDLDRALKLAKAEHQELRASLRNRGGVDRLRVLLTEIIPAAFAERIKADITQEARSGVPPRVQAAKAVLTSMQELRDSHERFAAEAPAIFADPPVRERDMAMNDQSSGRLRDVTVRLAAPTSHFSKLQAQLVATLDKFGLPHDQGILDVDREPGAQAEKLIDALDRRFEVISDPVVGFRAHVRKQPSGVVARRSGELTGRLALDARAIENDADRMALAIDEAVDAVIKHRPMKAQLIRRCRDAIAEQLSDVRSLVNRSSGIPYAHANARIETLRGRLSAFAKAIGLQPSSETAPISFRPGRQNWMKELPATDREIIIGSFAEASGAYESLVQRLGQAIGTRSRAESAFLFRRGLAAALASIGAVRLQMESEPKAFLWPATEVSLLDSEYEPQNLLDGLDETLQWLEPTARKFGCSDEAYENVLPEELAEVGLELAQIGTALGACADALKQAEASEEFIDLVDGLRQLVESASTQAVDTGDGSPARSNS